MVRFTNRAGETVNPDMAKIIAGLREGEHYLDENAPKDAWTLTGEKGLTVTQRFDDDTLDFAWLYAYPEVLGILEAELWRERVTVEPGASTHLEHTIEVK